MKSTDQIMNVVKEAITDLLTQAVGNTPYYTTYNIYPIPNKHGRRHLAARITLSTNENFKPV